MWINFRCFFELRILSAHHRLYEVLQRKSTAFLPFVILLEKFNAVFFLCETLVHLW